MDNLTIKVKDETTNEILFECGANEASKAFKFATEMEKYNIQIRIEAPNSLETLFSSLTPSSEDTDKLSNEIYNELDSHN
ncbi:MAG: hypothetical protein HN576_15805 [Bacteriovoracaceae bacterium]|jgi:hypothetical protein|nr:hypothetical protein [Bacteriovoracaceae bacterium]